MANIQGGELLLLLVLAVIILGPHRLPEYAAKLAHAVRNLRDMAEGAKSQIRQEMGPAFEDVNWRQLDPRQYDPRRIVREALSTSSPAATGSARTTAAAAGMVPLAADGTPAQDHPPRASRPRARRVRHDPSLPTPFDVDAT
jgi:sec-independent protein translocase protein TatB